MASFNKDHVFRTFQDLVAFVELNEELIHGDATMNAVWFCCHQKAQDMHDSYNIKDWAYEIQGGIRPMNTPGACQAWLDEQVGPNEPEEGWTGYTITDLQEFWGV